MEAICKGDYDKRVKAKETAEKEAVLNKSIRVPQVGFHDIYGVRFFGNLCSVIHQIQLSKFAIDRETWMHVFVDIQPDKVPDGIYDISVYGHKCRIYKWTAQGYHRGLIVLQDDKLACLSAQVFMESRTWSWVLSDEDRARLPPGFTGIEY